MRNLEQFISENREAFDTETPSLSIWAAIEQKLTPELDVEKFIADKRENFDTEIPSLSVWAAIEKKLTPELDIEKFVAENRADFDTEIPNLKIWAQIDKNINKGAEKRLILRGWFVRAAAAVALLVVGAASGILLNDSRKDAMAEKQVEQVLPNFKATEKYYNQQVEAKLTKLASYNSNDPSVLADLQQIDEVQEELKAELESAPSSAREEIVRRMIDNYKIKIGILERVLEHIEENPSNNLNNQQKSKQQNDSI
ncbi:MAG: hypothetical protein JNL70_17665 [Saprospiraceae bacterium]|nr:hypothetical protein [Saprospiraceae bacterium]